MTRPFDSGHGFSRWPSLIGLVVVIFALPLNAMQVRLSWLPEGTLTYQGFSARQDRLPEYRNHETYKSFFIEAYWRHPTQAYWGMDFRALQAGRTAAQEHVGAYQESPMILSIQHWELLMERDVVSRPKGFLAALGGLGAVTDQWERTKHIIANGVDVDSQVGLAEEGTTASGLRTSVENISIPLGLRWQWEPRASYFTGASLTYSFLMDFTDFLTGSSPFSGWSSQFRFIVGRRVWQTAEVFLGYFGYVNHMAAPAGQGGLRLRGGTLAPEGIYVLYQENEVRFSSALVGFGLHF